MNERLDPPPLPSSRSRALGFVLIAFGLLVGIFAGVVATQSIVQRRAPTDVVAGYAGLFIERPQAHFAKDRIALLLLGLDYNYDDKDQEYSTNARSDTIVAIGLNFPTDQSPNGSISILSIPRDTDVVMPGGHEDKINAAYAGGGPDPDKAARNSAKAVASFLGIPAFDRYVTLRINAAKELVDAIGGIDVIPDETMNYDDAWGHLHIHFVGGKLYHMNGEQAVSYSRFRHDVCGDPCRIKRQQQVLRIVIAKLKGDRFSDVGLVRNLVGIVRRNVYTDLSNGEALSLAWAFRHVDLANVKADQVPFIGDKDLGCCGNVLVADDVGKNALVKKLFLDPVGPPASPDPKVVAAIVPATIHVDVRNGSGMPGAGRRLADALQKQGFVIEAVRNADSFSYDATEIHVHSQSTPLAGERVRTALTLKSAVVQPDATPFQPTSTSDVTVIVGRDYAKPPQHEASAVK